MVTLRQLRYLEALAETLHFGNAADMCAVSQPALSTQIKELEAELQVSLVERRKSGVALTEQGAEIARRARIILASVRDLLDHAQHGDRMLSGSLKLGAIPSIAPYLLPAALPELQRRFPKPKLGQAAWHSGPSARRPTERGAVGLAPFADTQRQGFTPRGCPGRAAARRIGAILRGSLLAHVPRGR